MREAYNDGNFCFLSFVKDNCYDISVEYFANRFDEFVNTISTLPKIHDCEDDYHQYKALRCHVVEDETDDKI
ncbi:hypothetical protein L5515_009029 [Caenorhabditis briggsae]|uniref:Uncharacterized protein n=1 Tax=Caenorhabditis briggsae TaxID=6238 RepID=A0AAE9F8X8_CAEBR|nr:hypothetical protein L5515_009029 [Caenorhabditis briggsae]